MAKHKQQWAVIGAGPAGIAAVGGLLDASIAAQEIVWVDPDFAVGDLGQHWSTVSSNTNVSTFLQFLQAIHSFDYRRHANDFEIGQLNPKKCCQLEYVCQPLRWISNHLREQVKSYQSMINQLTKGNNCWQLTLADGQILLADKVILATGAEEKMLSHEQVEEISIKTALNKDRLEKICDVDHSVAVFGSSHSAMIIIRYLVEMGVKHIVNFYLRPIRYAIEQSGWTLYDNTGLKADTAEWVRENISKNCINSVKRYHSSPQNIEKYLPDCDRVIYAIGFESRHIDVEHVNLNQYDPYSGIIAPGLFGFGIGFPQINTTPLGQQELNVGLWKFVQDLQKALPIWQQYHL